MYMINVVIFITVIMSQMMLWYEMRINIIYFPFKEMDYIVGNISVIYNRNLEILDLLRAKFPFSEDITCTENFIPQKTSTNCVYLKIFF